MIQQGRHLEHHLIQERSLKIIKPEPEQCQCARARNLLQTFGAKKEFPSIEGKLDTVRYGKKDNIHIYPRPEDNVDRLYLPTQTNKLQISKPGSEVEVYLD